LIERVEKEDMLVLSGFTTDRVSDYCKATCIMDLPPFSVRQKKLGMFCFCQDFSMIISRGFQ